MTRQIEDFLLQHLRREVTAPPSDGLVDRRTFLFGMAAAGAAPASAGVLDYRPTARWASSAIVLAYGGKTWMIDRKAFDQRARLSLRRSSTGFSVHLHRARLPGTLIPVDFSLHVLRRGRQWISRIRMPHFRINSECELGDWISGRPILALLPPLHTSAGASSLKCARGRVALTAQNGLTIRLISSLRLSGQVDCSADGATFHAARSIIECDDNQRGWSTHVTFEASRPRPRGFACGDGELQAVACPIATTQFGGEFYDGPDGRAQALLLRGGAKLDIRRRGQVVAPITFDDAVLLIAKGRIGLAGHVGTTTFPVRSDRCVASLTGDPEKPFCAVFKAGSPPHFGAAMRATGMRLVVPGVQHAALSLPASSIMLATTLSQVAAAHAGDHLIIDSEQSAVALDRCSLSIRSGESLLDLIFQFEGFRCQAHGGGLRLVRRVESGKCVPAIIRVILPPQHLSETIQRIEDDTCPMPITEITQHFAARSRIVFALEAEPLATARWRVRDVTLDNLLDWRGLPLAVHPRARAQLADARKEMDEQVTASTIGRADGLNVAIAKIAALATAPTENMTSLELVDHLVFSPSKDVLWEHEAIGSSAETPLFGIRMGRVQNPNLRALSSRFFPRSLPQEADFKAEPNRPWSPEASAWSALTAKNHWEIIGQTSTYGLPALRRDIPVDDPKPGRRQSRPDPDTALTKVPRASVVRPDDKDDFAYLQEVDRLLAADPDRGFAKDPIPREAGIALSSVFQTADVTLTSLGATMRLDWHGEPPSLRPKDHTIDGYRLPSSFELERLAYQTWLGRDVRVIAVTKGYLIPFGMRASLMKVAERVFMPDGGTSVVAREIQRTFIVAPRTPKRFPALNQPDGGRDFPVGSLVLLTNRTPNLIDFRKTEGGALSIDGYPDDPTDAKAFWPRYRDPSGGSADVAWKVMADDNPAPFVTPMIFIANGAADDRIYLEKVVALYNGALRSGDPGRRLGWPASNVALMGGARRSYAPPKTPKDGGLPTVDTAFDTESWLLTARGRGDADTGKESFIVDARMNAADQPAFYPSVVRANIAIQSIDRLIGSPQGNIETQFFPPYVTGGFGTEKAPNPNNKGEIFLEAVGPSISLNPARAEKPTTGGLAQSDTTVAALSRIIGVVGGGKTKVSAVDGTPAMGGSFEQAINGKFDPGAFFDLKIFGVNLLDCIPKDQPLAKAPQLTELLDLGVDQKLLDDTVNPLAKQVLAIAIVLRGEIDAGIKVFEDQLPRHTPPFTFDSLYPDLARTYRSSMDVIIGELRALSLATSAAAIPEAAMKLSLAAKPLIREIGRAVRDPIPQAISVEIDAIVQQWELLAALFLNLPDALTAKLSELVATQLAALDALAADELALLFGLDKGDSLKALATDPALRRKVMGSLLGESLGDPLVTMLDTVAEALSELAGAIGFARAALEAELQTVIGGEVTAIAGKLLDPGGAANILRTSDSDRFAYELAAALDAGLRDLTRSGDIASAPATLRVIRTQLLDGGAARDRIADIVAAEVRKRIDWIDAVDPAQLTEIRATWSRRLTDSVIAVAITAADATIRRVLPTIEQRAGRSSDAIVGLIVQATVAPIRLAIALVNLSGVADAGRRMTGWCSSAADGAQAMLQALASEVLAPQAEIDGALADIGTALDTVAIPPSAPGGFVTRYGQIKQQVRASVGAAQKASQALDAARIRVTTASATDICTNAATAALAFSNAVRARGEVVSAMRSLASEIAALDDLVKTTADPGGLIKSAFAAALALLTAKAAEALVGASLAFGAGQPGPWTNIVAAGKRRLEQAITRRAYLDRLSSSFDRLVVEGQALAADARSASAAALPSLASRAMALGVFDRRFAGAVVETIALTDDAQQRIQAIGLVLMRGVADPLATLHDKAYEGFRPLTDLSTTYPALNYLLGGDVHEFDAAVAKIPDDTKLLHGLASASSATEASASFGTLSDRWTRETMPLVAATKSLAALADKILQGQFGPLLADSVRAVFNRLETELRHMVEQFIPSRVHTSYRWKTKLNPLGEIFVVKDSKDDDLVINSVVSFDFISRKRTALIEGAIRPFSITVGSLFTVYFSGATFKSVDGGEPDFKADVSNVVIGKGLSFLEVLQELVAVSGNGVYVRPEISRVTVGYAFARERTNIGSLTLSNIALDIYASLPFGSAPAEFGLLFASRERPFLISNPPYGGGGWVAIRCTAGGAPAIDLSFMFGAVTDIAFGPLKGRGRICAGIEFQSDSNKLTAFVEAVGEGNIACFSISIYIGIFLTHHGNGDFNGEARYEFKFKVGFVTLRYGVTARYTIAKRSGDSAGGAPPPRTGQVLDQRGVINRLMDGLVPPAFAAPPPALPKHVQCADVPLKSREWNRYRELVSMELLDG